MKIAVINKKGGVGKTPFAFSIAKDLGFYLQSNDSSLIEVIYHKKAKISKKVELLDNCVYDFGGFVDRGVLDIIKKCDYVIVPCLPSGNSIFKTIETIDEIKEYNQNIIVLATGLKDVIDGGIIQSKVSNNISMDNDISFYFFRESKIIDNTMLKKMSITELYNENGLSKNSYGDFYLLYDELLQELKKS
jgi:cellulose biosynthesis protein BcsQ